VLRSTARLAARGLSLAIGRELTVRLGRCLEDAGRLDGPNDLRVNGERLLMQWLVRHADPANGLTVLDVGANVGLWTRALSEEVSTRLDLDPRRVRVFAFEPASSSCEVLGAHSARLPVDVRVQQVALSNFQGRRALHIVGEAIGVNSFHPPHGMSVMRTEEVSVTTLDRFASATNIERMDAVKVDAEGEDMAILEGAQESLAARRIGLLQFEYNQRWIGARRFLKDAFDLILGYGYGLGKLTRAGWEEYTRWHPVLENYREANFLAIGAQWRGVLPRLEWWGRRIHGE
jgi:FkbM family methyltransferase